MRRALAALVLAFAVLGGDVHFSSVALAQQEPSRPRAVVRPKKAPEPQPQPKAPPPATNAQEKPLVELSETIGALAFLAQICSPATTPNPWRARMETLLDAEGDASGAREKMTGAFNQGYSEYSASYRQCTDAALTARRILTRDAARMARDLERRFGS